MEVQTLQNGLYNLYEFDCNLVCHCFHPPSAFSYTPYEASDLPIFFFQPTVHFTLVPYSSVLCEIIILQLPQTLMHLWTPISKYHLCYEA